MAIGIGVGSVVSQQDDTSASPSNSGNFNDATSDDSTSGDEVGERGDVSDVGSPVEDETTTSTTTTTMVTTTTDPETGALDALNWQILADLSRADSSIINSWVPQVSSKKLGITDRETGITYSTYQSILDDFRSSQQRYGDVLLLESGAFSTFSQGGLYVTVSAASFPTAEGANRWCDDRAISPNNCFAKYLSHTTPAGPDAQEYR